MVGLRIVWRTYLVNGHPLGTANPNFNVVANLNAAGPNSVSQLWNIQSVYIDNEGVDFPVYINFPDTFFTISCPANSAGWYQVFTNARQAFVCALGIQDASVNQITSVFFTDTRMVPSLDSEQPTEIPLWLGSPVIQRGNILTPGFGTPALGDQMVTATIGVAGGSPGVALPQFGPFPAPQFLYITQIQAYVGALINDGVDFIVASILLQNDVDGGVFVFDVYGGVSNSLNAGNPQIITDMRGNLRFRAQSNWSMVVNSSSHVQHGQLNVTFAYTLNPI